MTIVGWYNCSLRDLYPHASNMLWNTCERGIHGALIHHRHRTTTHINFWPWKFTFHKSNSFLQSWLSELVYEYLEEGADKSKCGHSRWSAGWPRTLITWNCSNLLYILRSYYFTFLLRRAAFPPQRSWMQWQPSLPWLLNRSFMKLIF